MKPFIVRLTRDASENCEILVLGEDARHAADKALDMAGKYGENVGPWETDEGNCHDCYLADDSVDFAEELTTPYCVVKYRNRPPLLIRMVWRPQIYTVGQSSKWQGFWVVEDVMGDKFAAEIITHNSVDGDRKGASSGNCGPFTWEIVGDPTKNPNEEE